MMQPSKNGDVVGSLSKRGTQVTRQASSRDGVHRQSYSLWWLQVSTPTNAEWCVHDSRRARQHYSQLRRELFVVVSWPAADGSGAERVVGEEQAIGPLVSKAISSEGNVTTYTTYNVGQAP